MDATTERLVDFAMQGEFGALASETVHECKRRLIDTFTCALAAYDQPLSRQARAVAKRYGGASGASIWGSTLQTTPEAAAFANGVMLRLLDMNDTYLSKSRGHPSDVISGIMAVGESVHADGASVINAITIAYDVYCSFSDVMDINEIGWDQPVYGVLACVVGAGRLLRLSREQMCNAVSLALTPNMALSQARHGHGNISNWKGCAGANAARNAVFASILAQEGFSGPTEIFEGKGGLWEVVGRFEWKLPAPGSPHFVTQTLMKSFAVCSHGQSTVQVALDLRPRVRVQDITEILIEADHYAVSAMGTDPSRWAPTTSETADHSMPYAIAIALLDGEITGRSYAQDRLADPAVAELMAKVKVGIDPHFASQYPESLPCRVTIRMSSGEILAGEVRYPQGHYKQPIEDRELEAKFRDMFCRHANKDRCDRALEALWNFDDARDVGRDALKLLAAS